MANGTTRAPSINIYIKPPFWLTWWFKLAAALIFVFSGPAFYFIRTHAIKKQKNRTGAAGKERTEQLARAIEVEKKSALEAEEANRAKSIFLATMSHEIQNPHERGDRHGFPARRNTFK
jgi:signal transduction histidine kinase